MMSTIERKPQQRRVPPLAGPVGNSKKNSSNDVKAVQSLLSFVGLLPQVKQVMPSGILDASDDTAIRTFQRQNNLREDGVLNPGGETEQALKKAAQPEQEETEDASLEAFQKRHARELKAEEKQRMQDAAQEIADNVKSKKENPAPPPERKPEDIPEDMGHSSSRTTDTPKPDRKPVSEEAEAALRRAQSDLTEKRHWYHLYYHYGCFTPVQQLVETGYLLLLLFAVIQLPVWLIYGGLTWMYKRTDHLKHLANTPEK